MQHVQIYGGTLATKEFYERRGWRREGGKLVDLNLYGPREDGPIRIAMQKQRNRRIREAIAPDGKRLNLVECGCGGTPASDLFDLCSHFTAVDFSATGLREAAGKLRQAGIAHETVEADMTHLPMADDTFDAAYSAHAVYHIWDARQQAAAFNEIMRIVKPGGVAVFVLANPFPLMFPLRAAMRLAASVPLLATVLRSIRGKAPIPYNPQRLGWMRRQLLQWGDVHITGYRMASTWFHRNVTELAGLGGRIWRMHEWLERSHPTAAARLGCYVTIVVRKHDVAT